MYYGIIYNSFLLFEAQNIVAMHLSIPILLNNRDVLVQVMIVLVYLITYHFLVYKKRGICVLI